ncbi:MAG TPA: site-specific integrase [Vicinamibacterales bacterium]|nr:site-specific integrase [Vicinamibacterales bacterium]
MRLHVDGQRLRVNLSARFPGEDVQVAAAKVKDLARRGALSAAANVATATMGDIIDRYTAAYPTRPHHYLARLRTMEVSGTILGDKAPDDVKTADIKVLVATWRQRKRTKQGKRGGQSAERHVKQSLRHLFNWAIEEGHATRTPFKTMQGVNLVHIKASDGRTRRLEPGEADRILAVADEYIRDLFTAILETACRQGELRGLQWQHVHNDHLVFFDTKTQERHEVPVLPTLKAVLDRRRKGPDGEDLPADAYVFGDDTGRFMKPRRLNELWRATCEKAQVRDLNLHDLRAESATQMIEAGAKVHEVRDALQHSNITMTNRYLRTRNRNNPAYQRRAEALTAS